MEGQMEVSKEKLFGNINSIIAVLLLVICFIPMFRVNTSELGYINDLSLSGFQALLGMAFNDGTEIGGTIIAIFLFLFPLILILVNYIAVLEMMKPYMVYIAPVGGIISLFITKMRIDSKVVTSVSTHIGFWLYLLLGLMLLVVSFLQIKNITFDSDNVRKFVEKPSHMVTNSSQELFYNVCPKCGARIENGKKFCYSCGTEIPVKEVQEKIKCSYCGNLVSKDSKFCPKCGNAVIVKKPENICPICGNTVKLEARFCPKCGNDLRKSEPEERVCTECGNVLSESNAFCPKCGKKVD